MEQLRSFFKKEVKNGRVLSTTALMREAKKRKLKVDRKQLSKLRSTWWATALHRQYVKPRHWQTTQFPSPGNLSLDFAYFHKNHSKQNDGYEGFVVCVSTLTGYMHAVPMRTKNKADFAKAVEEICTGAEFPMATTIFCDREAAIFSEEFRKMIKKKYHLNFIHLSRFSKATHAERAIRVRGSIPGLTGGA